MAAVTDAGRGTGTATHIAGAKAAPRVEASLACTAFTLSTSLREREEGWERDGGRGRDGGRERGMERGREEERMGEREEV
jgi:hypothetical protein